MAELDYGSKLFIPLKSGHMQQIRYDIHKAIILLSSKSPSRWENHLQEYRLRSSDKR